MYRYFSKNIVKRSICTDTITIRAFLSRYTTSFTQKPVSNFNLNEAKAVDHSKRYFVTQESPKLRNRESKGPNKKSHLYSSKDSSKLAKASIKHTQQITHKKVEKKKENGSGGGGGAILEKIKPLKFKTLETSRNEENIGVELVGKIEKSRMFNEVLLSFRRFCLNSSQLPVDLYIKLSDIIKNGANITDLYPYFLQHAHELFPHLQCMDELKQVSDLTEPSFWYVEAREIKRKIVYHSGPTNSGKTYAALQSFLTSSSGIYCGPLKLLANEVYIKANNAQTKCDLLTGEERKFADAQGVPAEHIACTVEMANLDKDYEVAVIDEIQMIKDAQRGWAWTRALLGLKAKTIHVCGDKSAVDLVSDLSFLTGDEFEVNNYERLTSLSIMNKAVESFDNVEPGDCFVCFNKQDIFTVASQLEKRGHEVAVIYGSMPPGVKLLQAARFNDPEDKCKILVATDAIGMGLNLNIRRIVFYSLRKPQAREKKIQEDNTSQTTKMDYITTSQALQIGGRAGRFNTAFKDGYVTTFVKTDLPILTHILKQPLETTSRAGLHPTSEQIELFGYHLPNHSLTELLRIFIAICRIDDGQYFLCNFDEIQYLASMIDHIPLKLKTKYTFATSPISEKQIYVCSCFAKFVRSYSNNEPINTEYLTKMLGWPFKVPSNLSEVIHLENVYDVLDLYLWLGYRFPEIFVDREQCKEMRIELEKVIYEGVKKITLSNQGTSNDKGGTGTRHLIDRNLHQPAKETNRYESQNSEQVKNMFSQSKTSTPTETTNEVTTSKSTSESQQQRPNDTENKRNITNKDDDQNGGGGGDRGGFGGGRGGGGFQRGGGGGFNSRGGDDGEMNQSFQQQHSQQNARSQNALGINPNAITYQVTISNSLAGAIIGPKGSNIQQMIKQSGADITTDKASSSTSDRILTITGSPEQIQKAQYLLQQNPSIQNALGNNPNAITYQVTISNKLVGAIFGFKGSKIEQMTKQSGAAITIDKASLSTSDRILTITGSPEQIQNAQYLLKQNPSIENALDDNSKAITKQVPIPNELVSKIIGTKGSNIQQMRKQSGAAITIDTSSSSTSDRILTITGSPEQIQKAQYLLQMTKVLKPKTENNTAAKKENHNSTNNQAVESFNNDESSITASTTIDEFAKILKSIKLKPPNTKLKHNQRKRQRPIESLIPKQIKNNDQLEFKLQLKKKKLIKKIQKDKLIKNTKDSLFLKNTVKDLFKKNNE